MAIRRREFLGSFGAASIAAALPLTKGEAHALASPLADSPWDVTWVDRIKGKYRAVFDSPAFSDGAALFRTRIWMQQYNDVYGVAPAEMSAVLVVRHQGIVLAMNDEFWQKYNIGRRKKLKDGDKNKFFDRNPIASSPANAPPRFSGMNIPKFIADGGIVLACNMAFMDPVSIVEKEEKLKHDEAEKKARTYLLPGVILQPSGIFAVLRAQEAGCNYILGS